MIEVRIIDLKKDVLLYKEQRELRNKILLRPIGMPDYGWEMFDSESFHFIALSNNEVAGCALLCPKEDSAKLMQMAVDDSFQNKGIGQAIVAKILEFSKTKKIKNIFCHSRENAVSFYEKCGFRTFGEVFKEVEINHIKMVIEL